MVELRATSAIVKVTRSLEQLHAQITAHLLITNFFFLQLHKLENGLYILCIKSKHRL